MHPDIVASFMWVSFRIKLQSLQKLDEAIDKEHECEHRESMTMCFCVVVYTYYCGVQRSQRKLYAI